MMKLVTVVCTLVVLAAAQDDFLYGTFPDGFQWGVATSAYQIEGAWNLNGKGESIWDYMCHSDPSGVESAHTGDVACDSYNNYEEDANVVKELGMSYYRFSLAWTRILPTGRLDEISQDGVDYYNRVIDNLLANGIKPLVTIYHWDLPQVFQAEFGGWTGEEIVDLYADYADLCFSLFGDRVKSWITLNEPWVIAYMGYGNAVYAPRINQSGTLDYMAGHNLLKSHARAWHNYNDNYRASQGGEIGITIDSSYYNPASDKPEDIEAAERAQQFKLGWFAHPIYSQEGDYPSVMKEYVARHSQEEGLPQSRLPEFDAAWVDYIKGTSDFFGLNHYSTANVIPGSWGALPSWDHDQDTAQFTDPEWPGSVAEWLKIVPWGFRNLLVWIKNEYNNPNVIVTENGYPDTGEMDDQDRITYYTGYINEMMKAVNIDGCNIYAYTAWSAVDNFEWAFGYNQKYGLYSVDFNDPTRPRMPKISAGVIKQIVSDNGFPAPN